jgi:putative copper resistance protein D
MSLLLDVFGFLSVLLRCLALTGAALVVGGVLFRHVIVLPVLDSATGPARDVLARLARVLRGSALLLALTALAVITLDSMVMMGSVQMSAAIALSAPSNIAALAVLLGALSIVFDSGERAWRAPCAALVILTGMVCTTHAVSRLEHTALLVGASALHQIGAYGWLGGLPGFLVVLNRAAAQDRARIALRYSHLCVAGVSLIVASAALKAWAYIGSFAAVYGSQYGAMSATKGVMLLILLTFGAGNFLAARRLAAAPALVSRVKRFVEVEMMIGASVMFVAGALTSLPPAVDLGTDLAPWSTVKERVFTLRAPRLVSPAASELAIPQAQARLDALAASHNQRALPVYVPGAGLSPPVEAADVLWSEYNHNWSGVFMLTIGLCALLAQAGWRAARHWPLLFLALGMFVLLRSDPESWPIGDINFFAAMRAPEVLQHRLAVLVVFVFAFFEWRVRTGALAGTRYEYVFPFSNVLGAVLLLSHSHDLNNQREALLMELSHLGIGLFALAAGCARWLEIRANGTLARVAAWLWPLSFIGLGLVLLFYRES